MSAARMALKLIILPLALGLLLVGSQTISTAQQTPAACPVGGYAIPACPVIDDSVIRSQIMARLAGSVSNPQNPVIVCVANGVVTLSGVVQTQGTRDMATVLTASVRGVTYIVNQLTVAPFNATDLILMGQVHKALDRFFFNSQHIRVDVQNGIVQLSGWVTNEVERENAAQVAQSVPGVRAVYNNITIRGPGNAAF